MSIERPSIGKFVGRSPLALWARLAFWTPLAILAPLAPGPLLLPALAQTSAVTPPPLSAYGELPDVERAAISPSGDRVVLLTKVRGERVLLAIQDQTTPLRVVRVGDMKIRSVRWVGEDRLLLIAGETIDLPANFTTDKYEANVAQIIPIDDSARGGVVFADDPRYFDGIIGNYGVREIDGEYYGFFGTMEFVRGDRRTGSRQWRFDHGRPFLYRVNLHDFDVERVDGPAREGHSRDRLIDARGALAFTLDVNDNSGAWQISNRSGRKIAEGKQARGAVSLIGLNHDGSQAIYAERGEDRTYYWEIGQTGGEPAAFLDDVDFEQLFFDRATGHLMGYTIGEGETERHVFFDPALEDKAERVRQAFSGGESWISGWTSDLSDVIVRTSGNGDSGTIYGVDLATNRANALAYARIAIEPQHVGPISTFAYTARDGLEMDGILTTPPGVEPQNLPVVVLPHGGPHSADLPVFDWWAQAFAARGYAVWQPNFRGSTNRDTAFARAGYGEWGRKMQTDKTDGLMALAEAGIVNPERACIVGASYGGYAALAGVTIEQGIYRCAVAVAPVSDLRAMYREDYRASGRDRTTKVALREQLGDPDLWDAVSPRRLAQRADAPIMLIHGVDDTIVPYSHSTKMADKLDDAGKLYELVTLDGEDHWLSLSLTRQQMLTNAMRWVETHNPAD